MWYRVRQVLINGRCNSRVVSGRQKAGSVGRSKCTSAHASRVLQQQVGLSAMFAEMPAGLHGNQLVVEG